MHMLRVFSTLRDDTARNSGTCPVGCIALAFAAVLLLAGCGGGNQEAAPAPASPAQVAEADQSTPEREQAPPTSIPRPTRTPTQSSTATPTPAPSPTATPAPTPIRFAIIGDYGLAGPEEEKVATMVKSWQPDFIVTLGDNNYPNGAAETIDENVGQYYHEYIHPYKGSYGEGAETNRFFPILGNHDLDIAGGQAFFDYFTLPGNERYYTFEQGPVEFFALNSMPGEPDGIESDSVQAEWLRQELAASSACWKLVLMHHAPYSSGHRGESTWMRWPFEEWGADATFAGHNHTYERIMHGDFPHFVNALGGGPRYAWAPAFVEGSTVQFNADHGAMRVEATPDQMTLQFIAASTEEVIDTYTMEQDCQ